MKIFKAKRISGLEKKALCEQFGVTYPRDLSHPQLEYLANSLPGTITILRMRLYNLWQRYIEEFKNMKGRVR